MVDVIFGNTSIVLNSEIVKNNETEEDYHELKPNLGLILQTVYGFVCVAGLLINLLLLSFIIGKRKQEVREQEETSLK